MKTENKSFAELREDINKAERALEEIRQSASAATFTAMVNSMEISRLRAEAAREKAGSPYHGPLLGSQTEVKSVERERTDFAHQIAEAETALETAKDAHREAMSALMGAPSIRIEITPDEVVTAD